MDKNELNIPGLKRKANLFEMPEEYPMQLEEKVLAKTLNINQASNAAGGKIKRYVWVTSLAASALFAIALIYSVYFKKNNSYVSDNLWSEEDEWVDAFSTGGEFELMDEDFVHVTSLLLEEQENESSVKAIESWILQEGIDEEEVVEVLTTEV